MAEGEAPDRRCAEEEETGRTTAADTTGANHTRAREAGPAGRTTQAGLERRKRRRQRRKREGRSEVIMGLSAGGRVDVCLRSPSSSERPRAVRAREEGSGDTYRMTAGRTPAGKGKATGEHPDRGDTEVGSRT